MLSLRRGDLLHRFRWLLTGGRLNWAVSCVDTFHAVDGCGQLGHTCSDGRGLTHFFRTDCDGGDGSGLDSLLGLDRQLRADWAVGGVNGLGALNCGSHNSQAGGNSSRLALVVRAGGDGHDGGTNLRLSDDRLRSLSACGWHRSLSLFSGCHRDVSHVSRQNSIDGVGGCDPGFQTGGSVARTTIANDPVSGEDTVIGDNVGFVNDFLRAGGGELCGRKLGC